MPTPPYYERGIPGVRQIVADTYTRPSSATQYAASDIIGNSATAGSVTGITFANVSRVTGQGAGAKIMGVRCIITPASSNLVITACDFDLLLFRAGTDIPVATGGYPADNGALTITPAAMKELVGVVPFVNTAWRNGLSTLVAGAVGWQVVVPSVNSPLPVDLSDLASPDLIGVMHAKAAWNPGAVANAFDFTLYVDQD